MKKVLFVVTVMVALVSGSAFAKNEKAEEKAAKVEKKEETKTATSAVWKPKIRI